MIFASSAAESIAVATVSAFEGLLSAAPVAVRIVEWTSFFVIDEPAVVAWPVQSLETGLAKENNP